MAASTLGLVVPVVGLRPVEIAASARFASSRVARKVHGRHAGLQSSFLRLHQVAAVPSSQSASSARAAVAPVVAEKKATIEFIRGLEELTVPEVKLTRARDGSSGTATFIFDQPSIFEQSTELGDITGLYMLDEEGIIQTIEVSAKFLNGRPQVIEARYIMRSEREWERFMRFMERYAESYGLGFTKAA